MSKLAKALTAAAGNAGGANLYVEDVFSTYLYTGTGSSLPIVNGIDLADSGGLVWTKRRTSANSNWFLDSERGGSQIIRSNTTEGQFTSAGLEITSFNSDGYTLGTAVDINSATQDDVSWTFRKAEKFFDVVTYTGTGSVQNIAHNLGSAPAFIITKKTSGTSNWATNDPSQANPWSGALLLNSTNAFTTASSVWNDTAPTDSVFTVGTADATNVSGQTYVAYLFASDAGGFGDDGSESIIKCGSYTGNGATGQEINLGFEPQWILAKCSSNADSWRLIDVMRGASYSSVNLLTPNDSSAELNLGSERIVPTATGFKLTSDWSLNSNGRSFIYIAIRRPMKTPESGTEVFDPSFRITGDPTIASGFVTDMGIVASRTGGGTTDYHLIGSRLTGNLGMTTTSTNAEVTRGLEPLKWDYNNGWGGSDTASSFAVWYSFKRATGFFDVVAYTGDGSGAKSFNHNLGVIPELMIVKGRNYTDSWYVYVGSLGSSNRVKLNTDAASGSAGTLWNNTSPTATQFTVGSGLNVSAETNITYLFATLAGVSKVGSYTGTGSFIDIDCGFSAGARFILIKRTDSTGDWYVWDSVRGIVAGNDPYLLLNSTAAEVTSTDYIDPLASGFRITTAGAEGPIGASGGTYIFLAIA